MAYKLHTSLRKYLSHYYQGRKKSYQIPYFTVTTEEKMFLIQNIYFQQLIQPHSVIRPSNKDFSLL